KLTFQAYGKENEAIYSVSRSLLNILIMDLAEKEGVKFVFEKRCQHVNLEHTIVYLSDLDSDEQFAVQSDMIVGADGVFSLVRGMMQRTNRFNYEQQYIEHGYKELTIPAGKDNSFQLEKNALHIWPRGNFMFIALPNLEGSFTGTFFFPFEGKPSFESVKSEQQVHDFWQETFGDVMPLAPDLVKEYFKNPTSSLVNIRCYPWVQRDNVFLIGDAAHGIVPFYGQGMNAGFEDCAVLDDLLEEFPDDWHQLLDVYQQARKPNADAIADLALENFIEMRDKVADEKFLLRKKIESHLHRTYPETWIPLYTMISFHHDISYAEAQYRGKQNDAVMSKIMSVQDIEKKWQSLDYEEFIKDLR
ncbi:MAG: FAD-dependent monooxygenase, partial [Verrucomicrobia bacterium]|nr:FAD-dependent monooxygenase [Cytophagales bacterium]